MVEKKTARLGVGPFDVGGAPLMLAFAECLLRLRNVHTILLNGAENLASRLLVHLGALRHRDLRVRPHVFGELHVVTALALVDRLERVETHLEGGHTDEVLRVRRRRDAVDGARERVGTHPRLARVLRLALLHDWAHDRDERLRNRRLVSAAGDRRTGTRECTVRLSHLALRDEDEEPAVLDFGVDADGTLHRRDSLLELTGLALRLRENREQISVVREALHGTRGDLRRELRLTVGRSGGDRTREVIGGGGTGVGLHVLVTGGERFLPTLRGEEEQ